MGTIILDEVGIPLNGFKVIDMNDIKEGVFSCILDVPGMVTCFWKNVVVDNNLVVPKVFSKSIIMIHFFPQMPKCPVPNV